MKANKEDFVPIKISEIALKEIIKIMANKSIPKNYGLRIGVKGAGCSGVSYLIGFDQKKETDDQYHLNGIPLYIEKKHVMYVIGLKVDFVDNAEERGFIFLKDE